MEEKINEAGIGNTGRVSIGDHAAKAARPIPGGGAAEKSGSPVRKRPIEKMKKNRRRHTAAQTIVLGFVALILIGTLLLMLPISSADGSFTDPMTALFTATSATCVTGLSVVTTASYWSGFGQVVILCMIQIGGLGFMSMAVLLALLLKKAITPREHILVAESLGTGTYDGAATSFMRMIVCGTFATELVGAAVLSIRLVPLYGPKGIYYSVFHSISAFCNAGFDILGENSMMPFADDPLVLLTLSFLILFGGIGFAVWADLFARIGAGRRRAVMAKELPAIVGRRDRFSVYTRFVLLCTLVLVVTGTALTAGLEWNHALAGMSVPQKLLNSFFYSVSLRTAGFASFDLSKMTDAGKAVSAFFMLVGGASGSTAGGLKVSTVAIVFFAAFRIALWNQEIVLFRRKIDQKLVLRAMSLVTIGLVFVTVATLFLLLFGEAAPIDCLYEVVSAYATVGLSAVGSATFGIPSRLILIGLMFMGRVGILTILYAFAERSARRKSIVSYVDTPFLIG